MTRAESSFQFMGCVELRQVVGRRALDERELMDRLEEVPLDSVYYHTHGYFLRHRPMSTPYGNDFAAWVAVHVRDMALAERLGVVNPFDSRSLDELRDDLCGIIDDHLARLSTVPRVEFGEPFYFQQAHIVEVALGSPAFTLAEFRTALAEVDASAIYVHMVEARARLRRRTDDFAEWIRGSLHLPELATRIERLDTYMTNLERIRARVLALVDGTLDGGRG
ncbi:MAG: hypothetical protein HYU41_21195 [Candidatus Rokubacteria bacterium]|nr:hypothetical protein [Candidatus Rokubacteria bacterium]